MAQFETGKTYKARLASNADQVVEITVAKRTAKTITTTEGKRLAITIYDGLETVRPWGNYSLAPFVWARAA